jgi:uncharacterized OsmC-like protein
METKGRVQRSRSSQRTRESVYTGFSPGKLIVAGLGMCTGMHAVTYLTKNNIDYSDLEITISTEGAGNPARYGAFNMDISVKADLSKEHYQGLIDECHRCFVGNTMKYQPEIKIGIKTV